MTPLPPLQISCSLEDTRRKRRNRPRPVIFYMPPPARNVHLGPLWPPVCQETLGAYSFNSAILIFDKT